MNDGNGWLWLLIVKYFFFFLRSHFFLSEKQQKRLFLSVMFTCTAYMILSEAESLKKVLWHLIKWLSGCKMLNVDDNEFRRSILTKKIIIIKLKSFNTFILLFKIFLVLKDYYNSGIILKIFFRKIHHRIFIKKFHWLY